MIETHHLAEETAHRETEEETGLNLCELVPVHRYLSSPGCTSETIQMYCGRVDAAGAGGLSGVAAEEVTAAQRIKALRDEGFQLQEIPRDERQRAELIDEFAGIGLKPELAGEAVEGFVAPELLLTHPVGLARQTLYPLLP